MSSELEVLQEILKWIKATSKQNIKKLLEDILNGDRERLAYHLSTGVTSREISSKVGVSFPTITDWWDKWCSIGLAEKVSVQGGGERGIRSFNLTDFGLSIPKSIVPRGVTNKAPQKTESEKLE